MVVGLLGLLLLALPIALPLIPSATAETRSFVSCFALMPCPNQNRGLGVGNGIHGQESAAGGMLPNFMSAGMSESFGFGCRMFRFAKTSCMHKNSGHGVRGRVFRKGSASAERGASLAGQYSMLGTSSHKSGGLKEQLQTRRNQGNDVVQISELQQNDHGVAAPTHLSRAVHSMHGTRQREILVLEA